MHTARNFIRCYSDTTMHSVWLKLEDGRTIHVLTDERSLPAIRDLVRSSPLSAESYLLRSEIKHRNKCIFVDVDGNRT